MNSALSDFACPLAGSGKCVPPAAPGLAACFRVANHRRWAWGAGQLRGGRQGCHQEQALRVLSHSNIKNNSHQTRVLKEPLQ